MTKREKVLELVHKHHGMLRKVSISSEKGAHAADIEFLSQADADAFSQEYAELMKEPEHGTY